MHTIYNLQLISQENMIGRDRHNINSTVDIVKRHFDITEIKVV